MTETQHFSPPEPEYADAASLVAATLAAFLPPARVSTADFAAAHRYLNNEGGGYVGRWNHEKAPYLCGIMDALDDADHLTVAVVGPGQCGKTAAGENWLMKQICADPADLLYFMHTDDAIKAYMKQTLNPMIEQHEQLRSRLGRARSDDSLSFKRFSGMSAQFLAATHSNLINKRAGRIIADEIDAYDEALGDVHELLNIRRQTYGRASKLYLLSHPDRAAGSKPAQWNAGIMAVYAVSDRRTWWWPCPECGMWSSPNPGQRHHMALHFDDKAPLEEIREKAHLVCPHNGCIVSDAERRGMNARGKWLAVGQMLDDETGEITGAPKSCDVAGFWIVGVMSPFVIGGIGELAASYAKAQRAAEATGDYAGLKTVVVKRLGWQYDPPRQLGTVDAATLADRADPTLSRGYVPAGCRFVTCGIDVQGDRFELLYRGWGRGSESWVIEHEVIAEFRGIPLDPATNGEAWDSVLQGALARSFPLADGSGRVMGVRAVGVDSAGAPGVTEQAYACWRRLRRAGVARKTGGDIAGRPAFNLLLLKGRVPKGQSVATEQRLTVVWPDTQRRDRRAAARGEIPLGLWNTNRAKDTLTAQLNAGLPGPGFVHIPAAFRSPEPPHSFFEQLVAEQRLPDGTWVKPAGARNEVLDLMLMAGVMAYLHGITRIDWQRPPPWAAEWSVNTAIGAPPVAADPVAAPAQAAAAARPVPPAIPPSPAGYGMRRSFRQIVTAIQEGRAQ